MNLREIEAEFHHYFIDEEGRKQGEYKDWHENGQQWELSHFRDDELHGECKAWNPSGELIVHRFDIDGEEIFDFLKSPELYPSTPEEKTMFALKYGNGKFIDA